VLIATERQGQNARQTLTSISSQVGVTDIAISVVTLIGLAEFAHLKKQFWGRHLWARGYFCCSSGNVTDEVVAEYIANRNQNQDEDFRVDG
jgi:REP element-mobilizing transposase RayT